MATQVVASRTATSRAIENSSLLDVTSRYLALVGAEGELYAIRKSEEGLMQVVRATAAFAKTGQGRVGDANRSRTQALLLHAQEMQAQETLAVAAAELARTLNLDPSVRLRTPAGMIEVVQLVDPGYQVEQLVPMASRSPGDFGRGCRRFGRRLSSPSRVPAAVVAGHLRRR